MTLHFNNVRVSYSIALLPPDLIHKMNKDELEYFSDDEFESQSRIRKRKVTLSADLPRMPDLTTVQIHSDSSQTQHNAKEVHIRNVYANDHFVSNESKSGIYHQVSALPKVRHHQRTGSLDSPIYKDTASDSQSFSSHHDQVSSQRRYPKLWPEEKSFTSMERSGN